MKDQSKRFTILAGVGIIFAGALASGCGNGGDDDATSGQEPATGTAGTTNSAPAANSATGPATGPGATPLVPPDSARPRAKSKE